MGVVVVKAGAIPKHEITFNFYKTQLTLAVLRGVVRFIGILAQFAHAKTSHIGMRIFTAVVPAHPDARFGGTAHQGNGFRHHVDFFGRIARNAYLRFQTELNDRIHLKRLCLKPRRLRGNRACAGAPARA